MGILYDSVKNASLHQEMKRNMIIERLEALKVTQNQFKESIYTLDYEELKTLLVLSEMRQVDIDHPSHKWFR
ncbi:hypothetical protein [Robertmurraya kyonggiensis]|uniref:Uncharacterized protein n=1 Tax=Robertmurraya kyonggiensis TaxID=1037680 RepID=A0A4U1D0L6_9BACI|nr:hypothetical protein [Robertmurraya kyonggiensis]TKC15701.1 hypothetical protein FA727_16380 [Robertmurraya kyonggiensis]